MKTILRLPWLAVFGGIFAVGSLTLAAANVSALVASADLRRMAGLIERGGTLDPTRVGEIAAREDLGRADHDCLVVRSAVTVRLALLDVSPFGFDVLADDARLDAAAASIRRALACSPLDANLWLRSAMVDAARGQFGESTMEALALSRRLAPYEEQIAAVRIAFAQHLAAGGLEPALPVLTADLESALPRMRERDLDALYRTATPRLRLLYRAAMEDVAPARRERLVRRFDLRDAELGTGEGDG